MMENRLPGRWWGFAGACRMGCVWISQSRLWPISDEVAMQGALHLWAGAGTNPTAHSFHLESMLCGSQRASAKT